MLLNVKELDGLKNSAQSSRKRKLKAIFLAEVAGVPSQENAPEVFFDRNFDTALKLPSLRDDELLDLCQIAYFQQVDLEDLAAYQRCEKEQKWPARALYLSAELEAVKESSGL
ncbi:hypothetical protein LF95_23700 [Thalassospira sp. TSL5-1]|nr:hypothetical protein LF95_23700 [Thalassospira sp. TSL5-1]